MAGHCVAAGGLVDHGSLDDAFIDLLQTHPELRALEAEAEAVAANRRTSADRPDRRPPPQRGIVATRCVAHARREPPAAPSNRDPIRLARRRVGRQLVERHLVRRVRPPLRPPPVGQGSRTPA